MTKRRGFTLIELLVVVSIIAVLIAILLPSMGRARERARTVRCATNVRSIGQAFQLYAVEWDDWAMPAKGSSGSRYNWWSPAMLGPIWNLRVNPNTPTSPEYITANAKIQKIMDCPANVHPDTAIAPNNANYPWQGDYTYNSNLGDHRYYEDGTQLPYIKRTKVDRRVLVLVEYNGAIEDKDGDRFLTVPDLLSNKKRAGSPHDNNKNGHMLRMDGSVILADPRLLETPNKAYDWLVRFRNSSGTVVAPGGDPFYQR